MSVLRLAVTVIRPREVFRSDSGEREFHRLSVFPVPAVTALSRSARSEARSAAFRGGGGQYANT
ncbi:hypothetical protein K378_04997 [Streptomyces sp. Amel2xB2]|nr:hypothetical protein K378_04997 [Streptomyces sp. Amel2xB2]